MDERLRKRFSIGLCLSEDSQKSVDFFCKYQNWLDSVYFSLPLGKKFYSRTELSREYDAIGANEKLCHLIKVLKEFHIKSEVAINMYGLSEFDIEKAIDYMKSNQIFPDEIVCLDEYGAQLKSAFPTCELKYSFNNPNPPTAQFDTIVVGKEYLRDEALRHQVIDAGSNLVLLLNNGCSFNCHYPCGDSNFCGAILECNLKKYNIDEIYAVQSFFPFELKKLLDEDPYSPQYRFKLSNRPLGIDFSARVMDSYCQLNHYTEDYLIQSCNENYGLYCVMYELFKRKDELNYDRIIDYKNKFGIHNNPMKHN